MEDVVVCECMFHFLLYPGPDCTQGGRVCKTASQGVQTGSRKPFTYGAGRGDIMPVAQDLFCFFILACVSVCVCVCVCVGECCCFSKVFQAPASFAAHCEFQKQTALFVNGHCCGGAVCMFLSLSLSVSHSRFT